MAKTTPLSNAPSALIELYLKINAKILRTQVNGKVIERDLLWELLCDSQMECAWGQLAKRRLTSANYRRLWSEITSALSKSRQPEPSRVSKQRHFVSIATAARSLSNMLSEGPLDRLIYEYYPPQMAEVALATSNWASMAMDERCALAHKKLDWWPSIPQLLEEVARHAEELSKQALIEERLAHNETADRQVNYFLQYLARHLRSHFGAPMKRVLADIASVVFQKPITPELVKAALRHH